MKCFFVFLLITVFCLFLSTFSCITVSLFLSYTSLFIPLSLSLCLFVTLCLFSLTSPSLFPSLSLLFSPYLSFFLSISCRSALQLCPWVSLLKRGHQRCSPSRFALLLAELAGYDSKSYLQWHHFIREETISILSRGFCEWGALSLWFRESVRWMGANETRSVSASVLLESIEKPQKKGKRWSDESFRKVHRMHSTPLLLLHRDKNHLHRYKTPEDPWKLLKKRNLAHPGPVLQITQQLQKIPPKSQKCNS